MSLPKYVEGQRVVLRDSGLIATVVDCNRAIAVVEAEPGELIAVAISRTQTLGDALLAARSRLNVLAEEVGHLPLRDVLFGMDASLTEAAQLADAADAVRGIA